MRAPDATRTAVCGALFSAVVVVAMLAGTALHGPTQPATTSAVGGVARGAVSAPVGER